MSTEAITSFAACLQAYRTRLQQLLLRAPCRLICRDSGQHKSAVVSWCTSAMEIALQLSTPLKLGDAFVMNTMLQLSNNGDEITSCGLLIPSTHNFLSPSSDVSSSLTTIAVREVEFEIAKKWHSAGDVFVFQLEYINDLIHNEIDTDGDTDHEMLFCEQLSIWQEQFTM